MGEGQADNTHTLTIRFFQFPNPPVRFSLVQGCSRIHLLLWLGSKPFTTQPIIATTITKSSKVLHIVLKENKELIIVEIQLND